MTTDPAPYVHPFERVGLGRAPFRCVGYQEIVFQAYPGAPTQAGGSCDACGTGIRHAFLIKSADGRSFKVGCDCVEKTGDSALAAEMRNLERSARAKRAAVARQARREAGIASRAEQARQRAAEWLAGQPSDVREAFEADHPVIKDIASKLAKYGSVSQAQIDLVLRLWQPGEVSTCAPPPALPVPAFTGRATVAVRVLGLRTDETPYGRVRKMLCSVRTPDGQWKAWSTVPSGAYEAVGNRPVVKGDELLISATVETSNDDPAFAFFRRPTIAKPKASRKAS